VKLISGVLEIILVFVCEELTELVLLAETDLDEDADPEDVLLYLEDSVLFEVCDQDILIVRIAVVVTVKESYPLFV
jgi:hypothetical protein